MKKSFCTQMGLTNQQLLLNRTHLHSFLCLHVCYPSKINQKPSKLKFNISSICQYHSACATIFLKMRPFFFLKILCFKTPKVKLTASYITAVDIDHLNTHSQVDFTHSSSIVKYLNQPNRLLICLDRCEFVDLHLTYYKNHIIFIIK